MSDRDTVTLQHELDSKDVERLIRIRENDLGGLWDIFDEMIEIASLVKSSERPVGPDLIEQFTKVGNLDEDLRDWARENDYNPNELRKIDIYVYHGVLMKGSLGYSLSDKLEDNEN